MPRLSLWRENRGNDYKFLDRRISEMFTVGGTGVHVHKYMGADTDENDGSDATKPKYNTNSVFNIQDLLFVENRDRKYDADIYTMRGIYQRQDQDFSLSQFGIFLAEGTLFMTFHLNDCLETLGRKLIPGDVLELRHLKDYWALDDSVPVALKRFYVIQDASFAAEGFSPTWYPHLWRVKLQPLVDSQEYRDILEKIKIDGDDPFEANANASPLSTVISTYEKYLGINQAIIEQAEIEVPRSGYDVTPYYALPAGNDETGPASADGLNASGNVKINGAGVVTTTNTSGVVNSNILNVEDAALVVLGSFVRTQNLGADSGITVLSKTDTTVLLSGPTTLAANSSVTFIPQNSVDTLTKQAPRAGQGRQTPDTGKTKGYLTGDGTGPNGLQVNTGIEFPDVSKNGDYFLRLDFVPNRLFRYNGRIWVKIEDAVRTNLTPGAADNQTWRNYWLENTDTFVDYQGNTRASISSLSKATKPKADN